MPVETVLQAEGLCKDFGGFRAVNDLSFGLEAGEILGLVGPNGAGKTTTFHLISGFLKPTRGTIRYLGRNITRLSPHRRAELGLVRTFQQTKVFSNLTVAENARIGFYLSERRKRQHWKHPDAVLAFAELDGMRDQLAGDLAYGDQRTLGIAIALGADPQLLLLDEPFAGMNPPETARCMKLIHRIRESGASVLLVDHHMDTMVQHCDRLVVMHHGDKLAEGDPTQMTKDPRVISVYLGDSEMDLTLKPAVPVPEKEGA